ncbi:hypothetical protein THAR02_07991 [Trichoderma harzianum]|uniref:Transcription factor domain-containing protein n=1 Tax=Trichoderma harzianum TaxID=5544 RepID=A0A0F9X5L4_TRIHA|nr:hypothetical protein THAR02_07991 [Trichoderma harzianum]
MATLMGPRTMTSNFFGPSSNIEFLRQVSDASAAILKANVQVRKSTTDAIEVATVEGSHAVNIPSGRLPKSLHTVNLSDLPKETIALRLIKLFFSDTGMIFPITDEETVLQAYYSVINVDDRLTNRSCVCLLNSIFAIATYISAKPDRSPIKNAEDSEAYCEKARAIWACTESNTAQLETEQRLNEWREKLYRQLQRRPWGNNNSTENDSEAVFDKLSTIMTLRYLNIRILLHRPILSTVLLRCHTSYSDRNPEKDPPFSRNVAELSIESCQQSAIDIIDIVYKTRDSYLALKTWWFTIYYTFNAAVVIFSCILLEITSPTTRSSSEQASTTTDTSRSDKIVNLFGHLQRAAESLQRVGEDTQQGSRVNKMLQKHLEISSRLIRENADRYSVPLSVISLDQETQDGNSQPSIYNWNSQLDDNELLAVTSCPPNPLEMLELETSQEWINSDLYTDLFQGGEGSAT